MKEQLFTVSIRHIKTSEEIKLEVWAKMWMKQPMVYVA